jgi:ligand-binding sensor domain-containing protein/signal transduction histidine kinase
MIRIPFLSGLLERSSPARNGRKFFPKAGGRGGFRRWWLAAGLAGALICPARAVILWTDADTTLAHETGPGADILGGAVKRDTSANDTLYFKFHVDPLSDKDTEEYFAAFELFEGNEERLGVGNALKAWAYSAFLPAEEPGATNGGSGYIDLHTLKPEVAAGTSASSYQYPRHGVGATIVFKVQFVPGEDALVTVWLNPDLGPGANEVYQPEGLTTRFNANATFDEIRLRHGGRGGGWKFSDLAIATSFSDFVDVSSARPNAAAPWIADGTRAFTFQAWQKEQGLPQGPLRALAQTAEGYLWIGGEDGLVRFDGSRFVPFGNPEGMGTGPVSALLVDRRGTLWVGSSDHGLGRWQDRQFRTFKQGDGLPATGITALAEDAGGRVWIGTEAGLTGWQNGKWNPPAGAEFFKGRRITALGGDAAGRMWVAAAGAGVFQYVHSEFVPLTAEVPIQLLRDVHCLLVDQSGRLWLGAGDDTVLCGDNDRWRQYRIPRNQMKSSVTALAEEGDGTVWAGSAGGGLVQFKDGRSVAIPAGSGLAGKLVGALLADQEGKLWVGTEAGLNRLRRRTLAALSQSEGLGLGAAQGLAEAASGVIWVAKPSDGLYRWDGKSFNHLTATGLSQHDSQITALLVTHEGFCWVATTNSLLLYKDPVAAADEVRVIESARPNVISLAEDREGGLWMGTREGKIWQLRANQWLELTNLAQTNAITAIVPDRNDSLWLGTDGNGLYLTANGSVMHLTRRAGLTSDVIRTLYLDEQGTLWIGTGDGGLDWWRSGRLFHFTSKEGLPDEHISQILEDGTGRLWLGTSRGIVCVDKRRLEELGRGKISAVYPRLFGRAEGMLAEECTGGFFPAGLKTKAGLLWFSTLKGVVAVNPRAETTPATDLPKVVLEEVLVDGVSHPVPPPSGQVQAGGKGGWEASPAGLRITPGRHRVDFRYTSVNFDAPDLIHFRYRLEGLDSDWVDAGTRHTVFYSYLPPGDYEFRVAASSNEGVWTDNEAGLHLVVLRHFWETWWFNSVAAVCLISALVGTVRLVERRKLARRLKLYEQERALERERTRIAHDLHDEMGAKLCRISFLSEHARRGQLPPAELHDQITSISIASREVLHSLDEIVWAVNPQNDTLEHVGSYIGQYAEEYFQMTGVVCELDIPTELPPYPLPSQNRHQLFLATHEALTNILKHSGATRAKIAMRFGEREFEIKVTDNGKGFVVPGSDPKNGRAAGVATGDGLKNMYQRLADIGGRCIMESTPGHGTVIRFIIPLKFSPTPSPINL